jgi:hypothetical protein
LQTAITIVATLMTLRYFKLPPLLVGAIGICELPLF